MFTSLLLLAFNIFSSFRRALVLRLAWLNRLTGVASRAGCTS